jgi:hypothetical protein
MFALRSAAIKFLVLRVTLGTVKTTVAILPVAIITIGKKILGKFRRGKVSLLNKTT